MVWNPLRKRPRTYNASASGSMRRRTGYEIPASRAYVLQTISGKKELKGVHRDLGSDFTAVDNANTDYAEFFQRIENGDGADQRIGRSCRMKRVVVRAYLTAPAGENVMCRVCLLYCDGSEDGSSFAAASFNDSIEKTKYPQIKHKLFDKFLQCSEDGNGRAYATFSINKKLYPKLEYPSTTGSPGNGRLIMLARADTATDIVMVGHIHLFFKDD